MEYSKGIENLILSGNAKSYVGQDLLLFEKELTREFSIKSLKDLDKSGVLIQFTQLESELGKKWIFNKNDIEHPNAVKITFLLQRFFSDTKFDCGIIDGVWGEKTRVGLKKFQAEYMNGGNGVPGPKTIKKIIEIYQEKQEVNKAPLIQKNITQNSKELLLDNDSIKKSFSDFYSKYPLSFISKKDILVLSEGNYYVATAMIMVHKLEQGKGGLLNIRKKIKDFLVGPIGESLSDADKYFVKNFSLGFSGIKSRGEFQIRYTKENLSKDDLSIFFGDYIKGKYNKINTLSDEDNQLLKSLYNEYEKKGDLNYYYRKQLLDNIGFNTIMASIYLKKRFHKTLDIYPILNKNSLNKNKDFILLSNTLEAYHKGPSWGLNAQNRINTILKIGEKLGIYKDNDIGSFQLQVRENTKVIKLGDLEIKSGMFGSVEFYERGKSLFTQALFRIKQNIIDNKKTIIEEIILSGEKEPQKLYNEIISGLNLDLNTSNFSMYKLSPPLIKSIEFLSKLYNVSFLDFTLDDYMNSYPSKALLVGNYGPSAWKLLNDK